MSFGTIGLLVFILSISVTAVTTPLIKKASIKFGLLDLPEKRKAHNSPTPRVGGIGIFTGIISACLLLIKYDPSLIPIVIGATLIFSMGIIDDIFGLSSKQKLILQLIIGTLTYYMGISVHFVSSPLGGMFFLKWLSFPLSLLWIVGMTNALNLIDGIDGLAAGITGISATMLSIVAITTQQYAAACLSLIILGSCLGFLKYNFSPAKIFMGDSGAMLLGYLLACTSIIGVMKSTATFSLLIPILMLSIPISDTLYAIIRRIRNKKKIFQADFDHFHHKLLKQGFSVKQITLGFYSLSLFFGIFALIISFSTGILSYIILGLLIIFATTIGILFKRKSTMVKSVLNLFL
jgi:UDP-GlcNAc:undecaprenyl-phosphate GlcNAc-1-phosphate transferase